MLRGESMFPEVASLPPTSLKNARAVLPEARVAGRALFPCARPDPVGESAERQPDYGKASLRFVRRLKSEESQRAVEFHELSKSFAGRVRTAASEVNAGRPGVKEDTGLDVLAGIAK